MSIRDNAFTDTQTRLHTNFHILIAMRYRLTLSRTGLADLLPINYATELSAWVYRTLHKANPVYAQFLQAQGYSSNEKTGQSFRFFTFSTLEVKHFKQMQQGESLQLFSEEVQLEVSFLSEEASVYFARGLAADPILRIAHGTNPIVFQVSRLEGLPTPTFQKRELYRSTSPISISVNRWQNGRLRQVYLSPTDAEFGPALIKNLIRKYQALTGRILSESSCRFELIGEAQSRLVSLHIGTAEETRVRGFHFDFVLTAPIELQRIAWLAGMGERNASGFGALRQLSASYEAMRDALQEMHQNMTPTMKAKNYARQRDWAMAA